MVLCGVGDEVKRRNPISRHAAAVAESQLFVLVPTAADSDASSRRT